MNIGGAERAVYQLIKEQYHSNIFSSLLVVDAGGFYSDSLIKEKVKVHFLHKKGIIDFRAAKYFLEICSDYNIIHFHVVEPYLMFIASKLKNTKVFYTRRGGEFPFNFRKFIKYKIAKYVVKNFDGISGNTSTACDFISDYWRIARHRVFTTYNGIDFSLLTPDASKGNIIKSYHLKELSSKIIIGSTANIRKWKRIDLLIRSMKLLNSRDIVCLIIGDGPEKKSLIKLSNSLGLDKQVIFIPKVNNISNFLQLFDIFVLPSDKQESFGNSIIEAMYFKIPTIIMSDGGGLIEHIRHLNTGLIANDLDDLVVNIKKLITNPILRKKLGENAMSFVTTKYSVQNMIKSYNEFYRQ